jgi:hypothetical protein
MEIFQQGIILKIKTNKMEQIVKHKNQWIDLDSILSISDSVLDECIYDDKYVVYYVNFKCAMYPGSSDFPLRVTFERELVNSPEIVSMDEFTALISDGFESYSETMILRTSDGTHKPVCEVNADKERDILLEQWIAWKKFKNQ